MARTKVTSKVLAPSAAQTNINNDGSFTLSVPTQINNTVSVSGNLTVDTNTLFVDSVNNRVGIGTSTPTSTLHVLGNNVAPLLRLENPSSATTYSEFNASGGLYIRDEEPVGSVGNPLLTLDGPYGSTVFYGSFFNIANINLNSSQSLYVGRGGGGLAVGPYSGGIVNKFHVAGNTSIGVNYRNSSAPTNGLLVEGNVGIGTTTPTAGYALDVVGAAKIGGNILCGGYILYLNSQQSLTQGTNSLTLGAATYFTTINYGNASTTIHNFAAGNVGIGTTTPSTSLHVVGSLRVDNGATSGALNLGADVQSTARTANARKLAAIVAPDYANTRNIEFITSDSNSSINNTVSIGGRSGGSNFAATTLHFVTSSTVSTAGGVNALTINSSQNVGIGTTTPNERLQVTNGNIGTFGNGNGFVMYNLGQGNYSGNFEMARFMPVSNEFLFQTLQGGTGVGRNLRFNVGNADITLVNSSGNVGIGTTSPTEKLTVAGNISVTGNISATGHFSAATKSFKIPHQSKGGHLQYGVVESDCHSVLVRGKISSDTITLPEHWSWLVDADSVTVQLTPVGCYQQLYIVSSDNQTVKVGGVTGEYCYVVYGTRKDVAPLEVEIE